jgi:hypothetical protein
MERGAENMTGKFLEVVVPVAAYQDVTRAASRHAARRGIEGKRILLLPSEKSSSPPFIDVLARRMKAETRAKRVFTQEADWPFFHPQRASAIAPEIDKVALECDLMISGVAY